MAVKPLFIADMAALEAAMRLTGVPTVSDAKTIIDEGVLQARMSFVKALTQTRVNTLKGYAYTDDPSTDEENLRMIANLTESMLVRLHLMRTLPVLFMDSAEKDEQAWNEEGLFRNKSPFDLEHEKNALKADIRDNLALLIGEDEMGQLSDLKITTMEPEVTPPRPGDSVWGRRSSVFGGTD